MCYLFFESISYPSRSLFLDLPSTDEYCQAIDTKDNLWALCSICRLRGQDFQVSICGDCPFTIGDWNADVNKSITHQRAVMTENEQTRLSAKIRKNDASLTKKDCQKYEEMSMIPLKITSFFVSKLNLMQKLGTLPPIIEAVNDGSGSGNTDTSSGKQRTMVLEVFSTII